MSPTALGPEADSGCPVRQASENPLARIGLTARASKCQQYVSGESNLPGKAVCPAPISLGSTSRMCLGALVDVSEITKQASLRDRFPRSRQKGVLPDVDSRTPAAASDKAAEGSGMGERTGASQAGQEGWAALRLCNLVAPGTGNAQRAVQAGSRKGTDGKGNGTVGGGLLQTVREPDAGLSSGQSKRRV
jgi:hypothetical protein